jgi:glycosyltransferase involved in cell wall biosynthesis
VILGTVGRFVPAKDYATLLRAAKPVLESNKGAQLWLVGDGPEKEALVRLSGELGIRDRVLFTGGQPDVSKYLSKMTVFVLSSITEGIPVAMLEAMAAGVPVVATRVGGIPEVISDGVDGLLVESRHPDALANAIARVARDVRLRCDLGRRGRERVASLCSRDAICARYEELFLELLAGRTGNVRQ